MGEDVACYLHNSGTEFELIYGILQGQYTEQGAKEGPMEKHKV